MVESDRQGEVVKDGMRVSLEIGWVNGGVVGSEESVGKRVSKGERVGKRRNWGRRRRGYKFEVGVSDTS